MMPTTHKAATATTTVKATRPSLVHVLLLASGLVLALASAGLSLENFRRVAYRAVAEAPFDTNVYPVLHAAPSGWLETASDAAFLLALCGRNGRSSAVTASLRQLGRLNQVDDYLGWSDAVLRATHDVRRSLECSPSDGFRWAQYAYLDRTAASLPARTDELLVTSQTLSPANINSVLLRLTVWWSLPDHPSPETYIQSRDMALFLSDADPAMVVAMLRTASKAVVRQARESYGSLPSKRQGHLRAAGLFVDPREAGQPPTLQDLLSGPSPFRR